jgi:uncharacterized membrane protein YfcA
VSAVDVLLLVCAGVGAGLTGSIAGLASLISYPALLAVGLGPIAANVTNTTALVFSTLGSVLGSRPELEGQAARLRPLALAGVLGGAAGAGLLLLTPSDTFERIAPWLIGAASLAILVRPRVHPEHQRAAAGPGLAAGVFAIAIYGGYFGAAAGVLLLAVLLRAGGTTLPHANAGKNVILGVANAVAAVAFMVLAPVQWLAIVPLGAGCLLGSRLGPVVVRRAPATPMRLAIGAAGAVLAVKLGIDAYA